MMDNFKYYNHLGFHNPYYFVENGKIRTFESFGQAIESLPGEKILDFTAVAQILNKGYVFGDRTLIKGLKKSPWMAKPYSDSENWHYYVVPEHQENNIPQEKIASTLFSLLKQEMLEYIGDKKNIGILLTGGMDSRVVACVLQNLIENRDVKDDLKVTAITWGKENSRDVVYASQIAEILKWEWKHLTVNVNNILENFQITVNNGCEYSPIHLHAMSQIKNINDFDCILAGSFGDSIGRGEYSGVHVSKLAAHSDSLINFGGFFRKDSFKTIKIETNKDVEKYHKLFPQAKNYQQFEQDYQLHYMRRMLNACMAIINKETPLYQLFSAPSVFGFMWSLNPILRNDYVYRDILNTYGENLKNIPWARTGLIYPEKKGQADKYKKRHHDYDKMLKNIILPKHKSKILSNEILGLNFFNMDALKKFYVLCENKPLDGQYFYEEKLFWIAALAEFVKKYRIKSDFQPFINGQDRIAEFATTAKYYYKFYR